MNKQEDIRINKWIENLQSIGKYSFSLDMLYADLPNYTNVGCKRALNRLSSKGKVISIYKSYYLIIPPEYSSRGILPPTQFMDALMKYLNRQYYISLLNAAGFYGASHQQPQEYFVVTNFPVMLTTKRKGLKINYIGKKEISNNLLETKKTETGYVKISNPALTASDLIQFEKRIGGINRASTVLSELVESIQPKMFNDEFVNYVPATALQRLGYIIENVLNNKNLADALYKAMKKSKIKFFRIPLKASSPKKGFSSDERWKVIINTEIEIDE